MKILIIDDSLLNREQAANILRKQNYSVVIAADGTKGLEAAMSEQPDLILLDLIMPGLDGFEVCQQLKQNSITQGIPVIFLTSIHNPQEIARAFQIGAVDYIVKPFHETELLARVGTHLQLRNSLRTLELNEKKFRGYIQNSFIAIFIMDHAGNLFDVNQQACHLTGFKRDELLQFSLFELFPQSEFAKIELLIQDVVAIQRAQSMLNFIRNDGKSFYLSLNISQIELDEYICFTTDVTLRIEAEMELAQQKHLLETILDGIPDIVSLQNPDQSIIHYNRAGYEFLKKLPEEVLGKKCYEFLGLVRPCLECATRQVMKERSIQVIEKKIGELDEWYECRSIPVFNAMGEIVLIVEQLHNITLRKQTESILLSLSERLELAAEVGNIGIWEIVYPQQKVIWNDQMFKIYDTTPFEYSPHYDSWFQQCHPDDLKILLGAIDESIRHRQKVDVEVRIITFKDNPRYVRAQASIFFDESGQPMRVIGVNWDVTNQHITEEKIMLAKIAAEKASQAKSEFLAKMSHEIRTPMNGIIGLSELLSENETVPSRREYLEMILESAYQLLDIINDILDFSKLEANKVTIKPTSFNLRETLEHSLGLLKKQCQHKGLELILTIDSQLPLSMVGDSLRVSQVLINLVSNAIKFTDTGSITINVREVTHLNEVQSSIIYVEFSIQDTGIGIPADKLEEIFESFNQADNSSSRKYGGTGLGLTIAQELVTMMEGKIEVISESGKGSLFHFTIPFKIDFSLISEGSRPESNFQSPEKNLKIFVAEDNYINLRLMTAMFKKLGYSIEFAQNGHLALESLEKKAYDIVFLDIHMPERSGTEITEIIRQRPGPNQQTPIIAVTADALQGDREKYLAAGMDDYIAKPYNINDIQRIITRHVLDFSSVNRDIPVNKPSIEIAADSKSLVFNSDGFLARIYHDYSLFSNIINLFIGQFPLDLKILEDAIKNRELQRVVRETHRLKGGVAILGAEEILSLLDAIENLSESRSDELDGLLVKIEMAYARFVVIAEEKLQQISNQIADIREL